MEHNDEGPTDAWEDDECLMCVPAPHRNCEAYTVLEMVDPSQVPVSDSDETHLVSIPVCMEHYEAFKSYQKADSVADVDNQ